MITPDSNRSFSVVEIKNFESPRHFKSDLFKYLQADPNLPPSPTKKNDDLKFIPYLQERDHLGNLLSKKLKSSSPTFPKSPTRIKFKSFDMGSSNQSPGLTVQTEGPDFKFEGFKYLPPITNKAKEALKNILKVSPSQRDSGIHSPCFLSQGRPKVSEKAVPSVGYYDASDSLLHKTVSEVTFSKKIRMAPLIKEEPNPKSTAESVDIMKSFNKVYNKPCLIPDFSKQINRYSYAKGDSLSNNNLCHRPTHQSSKSQYNIKLVGGKNSDKRGTSNQGKRKYLLVKDSSNEMQSKSFLTCENPHLTILIEFQNSPTLNTENLPYTTFGLHDKFGQVKKKYNIFTMKLK